MTDGPKHAELDRGSGLVLLASIFVIAGCGLAYELLAGTLSSYLLGNSVTQFSVVIGLFLTAMGIGSFLSRYIHKNLIRRFLQIEIAVGVIGGLSPLALFFAFAVVDNYTPLLVTVCLLVGALVGLEIPLLVRIMRARLSLRAALGNVLSVDYLGALAASLLFPLVLLPNLGLARTGAMFGMLNIGVAMLGIYVFRRQLRRTLLLSVSAAAAFVLLAGVFVSGGRTTSMLEDMLYQDDVIYAETTPYQRIVLTRWRGDVRLFINGNIQFSSTDEFRYHESLVHPAMGVVSSPQNVLILGGGDGLAAREVLKHESVTSIDLVDLDPAITRLFREVRLLTELNDNSLNDERVRVFNEDAFEYMERAERRYDVIIIDLPDPNDESVGKLYTRSFYRLVAKHLSPVGVMVTQATSPFYATDAYWSIVATIEASDVTPGGPHLQALPYHASVPSFGDWGFVMAALRPMAPADIRLDVPTEFLSPELVPTLFVFPRDIGRRDSPVNRLDDQVLVRLYRRWGTP